MRCGYAARLLCVPLQPSVKRRPASRANGSCRSTFLDCRVDLEVLLSLLFALDSETEWSRRIWVCEGTVGAN
jgi:hypothetical protein